VTSNRQTGLFAAGAATLDATEFTEEPETAVFVGGGELKATGCTFSKNKIHMEATGGSKSEVTGSEFTGSTGNCGIHVLEAVATFTECKFTDDSEVALFSEGELSVVEGTVQGAGRVGMVFDGKASGTVSGSVFENNGDCALQCLLGSPTIAANAIGAHGKFGVFLCRDARPVLDQNTFTKSPLANIWRN
jgi:hypothetical protein